jgi:excisionase family DNA binding protein
MKELLTTKEAAALADVTDGRIRQLILVGILPAEKFGRAHLIRREDLKLLENRGKGRPKKKAA